MTLRRIGAAALRYLERYGTAIGLIATGPLPLVIPAREDGPAPAVPEPREPAYSIVDAK
jgi:hypothetical protein